MREPKKPTKSSRSGHHTTNGDRGELLNQTSDDGLRWSVERKREVVLRIFLGETLEDLSRELEVEIDSLEYWRDCALGGIDDSLRTAEERRIHGRVETEFPCEITTDRGSFSGRIGDLSYGGALILGKSGMACVGDSMSVEVAWAEDEEAIMILGEVVRMQERISEGKSKYGVRFSLVEPRQREELNRLIERLLVGSGMKVRKHPRVYRRLLVNCTTRKQFVVMMHNISLGGIGVDCNTPLVVEEQVTVEISIEGGENTIELSGIVRHVRQSAASKYHVGIRFASTSVEDQQKVKDLIRSLTEEL